MTDKFVMSQADSLIIARVYPHPFEESFFEGAGTPMQVSLPLGFRLSFFAKNLTQRLNQTGLGLPTV
jgi:hypothetical protein